MADQNTDPGNTVVDPKTTTTDPKTTNVTDPNVPDIDAIVDTKVNEKLKPIKQNLDNAYAARDAEKKRADEAEKKIRDAEVARLQEEGKHREAAELQIKEEREKREAAEKKVIELTRDNTLRSALSGLEFRSSNATDMAFKEMVGNLVQNDKGEWVHKSGVAIADYVKTFADNSDNSFLFKQKVNTGGGSGNLTPSNVETKKTESVFALTQDEVLKRAAEGKLPNQQRKK